MARSLGFSQDIRCDQNDGDADNYSESEQEAKSLAGHCGALVKAEDHIQYGRHHKAFCPL